MVELLSINGFNVLLVKLSGDSRVLVMTWLNNADWKLLYSTGI